jgi:thymidylate synthase (FAD)
MTNKVSLVWATPNGEQLMAYMARVSNPSNQDNEATAGKLIKYLTSNKHWSPLDMVDMCVEIETTRDIARQILRHRSFFFQEFSQRYADPRQLSYSLSEMRLQDVKNRQNSIVPEPTIANAMVQDEWTKRQMRIVDLANETYQWAVDNNIAKELSRKVLPEGLTASRMYMKGTVRSWLHYIQVRTDMSTQKEHRDVAEQCKALLVTYYPSLKDSI